MELHSPVIAKRLWNVLRITYLMIRKGVVSKRKLMMDMNLMMKRGKLLRKSLSNLISHHHHSKNAARAAGLQEYEFSCSNSPAPVFFRVPRRKHHYFPCINDPQVIEEEEDDQDQSPWPLLWCPTVPRRTHSTFDLMPLISLRDSLLFPNYVRVQSRMQLLQYQELQYQEMLARGTHH
ncbi:hypothetical protein SLA2020_453250 [Shorea laevis]